jgi:hypothetical protein
MVTQGLPDDGLIRNVKRTTLLIAIQHLALQSSSDSCNIYMYLPLHYITFAIHFRAAVPTNSPLCDQT